MDVAGYDGLVEIGRGASAVVYRARQLAFDRTVALKVLVTTALDDDARRRFDRECRAVAQLGWHPRVVPVFDAGVTEGGHPYLVMEFLPAGSLALALKRDGAIAERSVVSLGIQVADAMEAAHRDGILHRDVKPGNILRDHFGDVKLADFGIASISSANTSVTEALAGTLSFMAPELLGGGRATAQSDLYSLGSTLYTLLTARTAFSSVTDESPLATLMRIAKDPLPDLRLQGISDPVATAVEQAMARQPADRLATAAELVEVLRAVEATQGWTATPTFVDRRPAVGSSLPPVASTGDARGPSSATPDAPGLLDEETRLRPHPDPGVPSPAAAPAAATPPVTGPATTGPATDPLAPADAATVDAGDPATSGRARPAEDRRSLLADRPHLAGGSASDGPPPVVPAGRGGWREHDDEVAQARRRRSRRRLLVAMVLVLVLGLVGGGAALAARNTGSDAAAEGQTESESTEQTYPLGDGGEETLATDPPATTTTTAPPSTPEAIAASDLDGEYEGKRRQTECTGFDEKSCDPTAEHDTYMTVRCSAAGCTVDALVQEVLLAHQGAEFLGTLTGVEAGFSCKGAPIVSNHEIHLVPTAARYVDGAWQASSLSGSLVTEILDSASDSCSGSRMVYSFTVERVG
ncbi:MAG: pknK [Acidimicrobiales bacterium]|nr:pknK [Acidimicrobiales bacterium]